jgi:hypothetical protein
VIDAMQAEAEEQEVIPVSQPVLPFIPRTSLEHFLSDMGVPFARENAAALDGLVRIDESQVRSVRNRAPKEQVTIYAVQYANGAEFPPIVICEIKMPNGRVQRILVDGNTRVGAAGRLHWNTLPAYVIQCTSADQMFLIATKLNGENGNPFEKEEALANAGRLLLQGHSPKQVAMLTGYEANYVRKLQREIEFEERRQQMSLDVATDISRHQRAAITKAARLDPVFVELARLVSDSGLRTQDIDKLGDAIGDANSQEQQLRLIAEKRLEPEIAERIRRRREGIPSGKPSLPTQASMHIGWLYKQTASQLVDYDPSHRQRNIMQIRQAIMVLQQLLEAYGEPFEDDSEATASS